MVTQTEVIEDVRGKVFDLYQKYGFNIQVAADAISEYLATVDVVPEHVTSWLKEVVQKEAANEWIKRGQKGAVVAATGVGKSKIGINIISILHQANPHVKVLIVVPTEKLRDQNWMDEFNKWHCMHIYANNISRECYASLHKIEDEEFDLVILDEYHNITENNSQFFAKNRVHRILALSATHPYRDEIKREILQNIGIGISYHINLDTSVKLRLVAPYEIVIIETHLGNTDKCVKAGSKLKPFMQTEQEQYTYLSNNIAMKQMSDDYRIRASIKFATLARMRFIYNLRSKEIVARMILNLIPRGERVLTFCGSIAQAEALAEDKATFHSKTKDIHLHKFQEGKIERLTCVNALNEGMNLPAVDYGVIVQLNSNERNLIQRIGRLIRYEEGHIGKIIVIVCVDTQDKSWAINALQGLDTTKIRYLKIQDLINGVERL